jgi:hypothetical protein
MTEQCLLGVAHMSAKDDVYRGFFIPKGQILLNCTFCIQSFPLFILPKRILGDSKRLVRQLPIHLYI